MGIGAGLLGFVQGASSSLGAAAAQQVQSDIDLERQLSLEQIVAQRNKTRTIEQIKALQNNLDEDDPRREIDPSIGLKGFEFISNELEAKAEAERKAEEEANKIAASTNVFLGLNIPADQAIDLARAGVDPGSELIQRITKETPESISIEDAEELANVLGVTPAQSSTLFNRGLLNPAAVASLAKDARSGGTKKSLSSGNITHVINPQTGERRVTTLENALLLQSEGWELARVEEADGDFLLVTGNRAIQIDEEALSGSETGFAAFRSQVEERLDNPVAKAMGINHADFSLMRGTDELGAATGIVDNLVRFSASLPIIGDIGAAFNENVAQDQLRATPRLGAISSDLRIYLDAGGSRPLAGVLAEVRQRFQAPEGFGRLSPDATLIQKMDSFRQTIEFSQRRFEEASRNRNFSRAERKEMKLKLDQGEKILAQVDALKADRLIATTRVPLKNGDFITIGDIKNPQVAEGVAENGVDISKTSPEQRQLLGLWSAHLNSLRF